MKRNYHTVDKQGRVGERRLAEFLVRDGQALLPMMELAAAFPVPFKLDVPVSVRFSTLAPNV